MRSFEVEGRVYRSIPEFCKANGVGYWRMIRLCGKYVRAHKDPAVAARWLLGIEELNYAVEQKTWAGIRDLELATIRKIGSVARTKQQKKRIVIDDILPLMKTKKYS